VPGRHGIGTAVVSVTQQSERNRPPHSAGPVVPSFDDFPSPALRLLDVGLLRRHYRPETLPGERARREWVEPDLTPLPA
jgi:hypothetical protein